MATEVINHEGFWWSKHEPHLPMPIAQAEKWKGREDFLKALAHVEGAVGLNLLKGIIVHYRGWSTCRLCGEKNGSSEYRCISMESTWEWPSGYAHYVAAHNVRPSQAFQEFILTASASKVKLKD